MTRWCVLNTFLMRIFCELIQCSSVRSSFSWLFFNMILCVTLPKTNIAPTNGWLEYYFPIGFRPIFRGELAVSFREGMSCQDSAERKTSLTTLKRPAGSPQRPAWSPQLLGGSPQLLGGSFHRCNCQFKYVVLWDSPPEIPLTEGLPGASMTSIFEGQPPKTRPKLQPKQGSFGYTYVHIHTCPSYPMTMQHSLCFVFFTSKSSLIWGCH